MASHGVPRSSKTGDKSEAARAKEVKEIQRYRKLVDELHVQLEIRQEGEFSPELLQKTTDILKINPEYYTVWNHRRRIYLREFDDISHGKDVDGASLSADTKDKQVLDILQLDLQFLLPLLIQFPKCYWIWNHRLWLLNQSTLLLPCSKSRPLWEEELQLVGKMLARDSRNFLGWGYRRTIVTNLESPALKGESMAQQELEYTTKMIKSNLSNFSAWHNRSQLISRILDEQSADVTERRQMLDDELAFIHNALFDPYDQSLWFYHQNLLASFDPSQASKSIAPALDRSERIRYLEKEIDFISEMLEDTQDCKWIYQALIECKLLMGQIQGSLSSSDQFIMKDWLNRLKSLDQLRQGRWEDLEARLNASFGSVLPTKALSGETVEE